MSEHLLRLSKADDEDERDMIYDGIYEVAEVCPYLSADMVSRYNNHERLVDYLRLIVDERNGKDPDGEIADNTFTEGAATLLAALEAEKGGEL